MKKPSQTDFNLKSFKMLNNGGANLEFNYKFSEGNEAHEDSISVKRTLSVHKDLFDILLKQKANILRVEEINYRLAVTTAQEMGIDNIQELSQIAEGMIQEAMIKIQPTGFKISGKDEKRLIVITYKKMMGDKKITGRATTAILLSANTYGFEEELEADIQDFISECYQYLYKNKHSESDQLQFDLFGEDIEEIEETQEPVEGE